MNNYYHDSDPLQCAVSNLLAQEFTSWAPPATMRTKLSRTPNMENICKKVIERAYEKGNGKLTVKRKGIVIDDNGHRVEMFAFKIGLYAIDQTLYEGILVAMLSGEYHLLLVRSDVRTPLNILFPNIGTAQDWAVLRKCIDRFSPKASSHRHVIDMRKSQNVAVEAAAANCLEQVGTFQQRDLEILQGMVHAKLHVLDLCAIIALTLAFTEELEPRMIHVLCTRNADDLDEIQRVFKAWTFSPGRQSPGLYIPSITVTGKNSFATWQVSKKFAYIRYNKAQDVDYIFAAMSRALVLDDAAFSQAFPYPPVVVGPQIWSDRNCVEIDMRGLRFSDEELLMGRKYIASLLKAHEHLTMAFTESWQQCVASYNAVVTPYPQLWFQAFHFAAGKTLFPASPILMDYLNITHEADICRLRLRADRTQRYEDAIQKLKTATNAESWLYLSKPRTKAEALNLLKKKYDAFLHQKAGNPVFAFTEASLIRCANLEQVEIHDFISKLRENCLLSNKTHPVSFANREQCRFICINAEAITVTDDSRRGAAR